MRFHSELTTRRHLPLAFLAAVSLTLPLVLGASDSSDVLAARASADVVLVRVDETVDEDLYAGGNTITIEGTIEGDLIVFAFELLEVSGTVEGDIIGYASTARINGSVGGSVRLVSGNLSAAGEIEGDLMAIAWSVATEATIGRDLLTWSRSLRVGGEVGRDVEGQTYGTAVIDATVGREVEISVNGLRVTGATSIRQDLAYRSAATATVDEAATIGGTIIRRSPLEPNISVRAVRLVGASLGVLAFLWLGLLAIWLMPSTLRLAVESIKGELSRSFFVGFGAAVTPIALLAAVIAIAVTAPPELALTILAVAAPFGLVVLAVFMVAMILAPVPVAIVIGRAIAGRHRSAFGAYLIGALVLAVTLVIPVVRLIVVLTVGIAGLGALVRSGLSSRGSLAWASAGTRRPRHRERSGSDDDSRDSIAELEDRSGETPDDPDDLP